MPLPFQEAQDNYDAANRPSLLGRVGKGLADVPSDILNDGVNFNQALNFGQPTADRFSDSEIASAQIPTPFDIPARTTPLSFSSTDGWGEFAADLPRPIAKFAVENLIPMAKVTQLARGLGAAPVVARAIGQAVGFGLPSLANSPSEAGVQSGVGAAGSLASEFLPPAARYAAALVAGGVSAADAYYNGATPAEATAQGLLNGAVPLLFRGKKALKSPETPTSSAETVTPTSSSPLANQVAADTNTSLGTDPNTYAEQGPTILDSLNRRSTATATDQTIATAPPEGEGDVFTKVQRQIPPAEASANVMQDSLLAHSNARQNVADYNRLKQSLGNTENLLSSPRTLTEQAIATAPEGEGDIFASMQKRPNVDAPTPGTELGKNTPAVVPEPEPIVTKPEPEPIVTKPEPIPVPEPEPVTTKAKPRAQNLSKLSIISTAIKDPNTGEIHTGPEWNTSHQQIAITKDANGSSPFMRSLNGETMDPQEHGGFLAKSKTGKPVFLNREDAMKVAQRTKQTSLGPDHTKLSSQFLTESPEQVAAKINKSAAIEPEVGANKKKVSELSFDELDSFLGKNNLRVAPDLKGSGDGVHFASTEPGNRVNFAVGEHATVEEVEQKLKQEIASMQTRAKVDKQVIESRTPAPLSPSEAKAADEAISDLNTNKTQIAEDFAKKAAKSTLNRFLKRKSYRDGEEAFSDLNVPLFIARGILGGTAGAYFGAQVAPDDEVAAAVIGAIAFGFGGKAFKLRKFLADIEQIKKTATVPGKKVLDNMADEYDPGQGKEGKVSKLASFVRTAFTSDETITRTKDQARGIILEHLHVVEQGLKYLRESKMLPTVSKVVDDYLSGKATYSQLRVIAPDVAVQAAGIRNGLDALSKIVGDAVTSANLASVIEKQLGTYLTRAYKLFIDDNYYPSEASIIAVLAKMDPLKGQLYNRKIIEQYIREAKADGFMFTGSSNPDVATLSNILFKSKNLDPAFREFLGEIKDVRQRATLTALKLSQASQAAAWFDLIAKSKTAAGNDFVHEPLQWEQKMQRMASDLKAMSPNDPKFASMQKQYRELAEYVPLPISDRLGGLSGKMGHYRVRDQVPNDSLLWGLQENHVLNALGDFNSIYKIGHLALNPLTSWRNFLQISVFAWIAKAGGPQALKAAYNEMRDKSPMYQEALRLGIFEGSPSHGELMRDRRSFMAATSDQPIRNAIRNFIDGASKLYGTPDAVVRFSSYMRAKVRFMADGMSESAAQEAAINHVNRYTMNYANVAPAIKILRNVPFVSLFITYTAEMTRIAKNVAEDALHGDPRAIITLAGLATIPAAAQAMSENQLSDKDRKAWEIAKAQMPDYARGKFRIVLSRDAKTGNFKYWEFDPLVPTNDFSHMLHGLATQDAGAIWAQNPLIGWDNTPALNVVSEMVTGKDRYTGQAMSVADRLLDPAKELLPPLLGYEGKKVIDAFTPNADGGLGVENKYSGKSITPGNLVARYVFGSNFTQINPAFLQTKVVNDAKRQIADLRSAFVQIARTNATDTAKAQAQAQMVDGIKQILDALKQKINPTP